MSLEKLADEIVRLGRDGRSTPVLVTPNYLTFRPVFFREFTTLLAARTDRSIRIDWLRGEHRVWGGGIWATIGDRIASRKAATISHSIRAIGSTNSVAGDHVMQVTATIGRPNAHSGELVIGLCHTDQPLPAWATPIPLSPNRFDGSSV